MVLALAPEAVVEDAQGLQGLVERTRAVRGDLSERGGDLREPLFRGGLAVAFDELQHGDGGEAGVREEENALVVPLGAGARKARVHLADAGEKAVVDRGAEVGGQVEDDALLAVRNALRLVGGDLGVGVEVGDLLDRAEERDRLALHKGWLLSLEHFDEAHARARRVVHAVCDEAVQQRLPVHVAAEFPLYFVESLIQQILDSVGHLAPCP